MKPTILILAFFTIACSRTSIDTAQFCLWWQHTIFTDDAKALPPGITARDIEFKSLQRISAHKIENPPLIHADSTLAFEIWQSSGMSIEIVCPVFNVEALSESDSLDTNSRIRLLPGGAWTSIDCQPFSNDVYGPDEVSFRLFWIAGQTVPLLEIMTNGPACVPAYLYAFDSRLHQFVLKGKACGG